MCPSSISVINMAATLEQRLIEFREEMLRIGASYGARNLRIFGSVARCDAGSDSDLDLLVDMESGRSLLDLSRKILTVLPPPAIVRPKNELKPRMGAAACEGVTRSQGRFLPTR